MIVAAAPAYPFCPVAVQVLVKSAIADGTCALHRHLIPDCFSTSLLNDFESFAGIIISSTLDIFDY